MSKKALYLPLIALAMVACSSDDDGTNLPDDNQVTPPAFYVFERDNTTTVSFSGQTTRILMAEELVGAMKEFESTAEQMLAMYNHAEGDNDFSDAALNASSKNIRSKTAASADYFSTNATEATIIKTTFEGYINAQVNTVFPNIKVAASPGVAGQIADGASTRYVDGKGLEMDQLFGKGLIGAMMADQMLNNYLSPAVLDEGTNIADNDNELLADGSNYTNMEHKWDEAYGYLFGTSSSGSDPLATLGEDDSFLNKYLGRVEGDEDFTGIAQEIFDAFKLGRAAIVAKNYEVRDQQAAIIRQKVSEVIAIRAVYYLQQGKIAIQDGNNGAAFHDLSEGFGFIYSLRFTHNADTGASYFSRTDVDGMIEALLGDGANGLWDVSPSTLDTISENIAAQFDFTVAQAGS